MRFQVMLDLHCPHFQAIFAKAPASLEKGNAARALAIIDQAAELAPEAASAMLLGAAETLPLVGTMGRGIGRTLLLRAAVRAWLLTDEAKVEALAEADFLDREADHIDWSVRVMKADYPPMASRDARFQAAHLRRRGQGVAVSARQVAA